LKVGLSGHLVFHLAVAGDHPRRDLAFQAELPDQILPGRMLTARPGQVHNCPTPNITEFFMPSAIALARSLSAPGRTALPFRML